ncbi:phosphate acyltransferase PlsX [Holospora curviuscula]|uniref:Phosphate acyltransferase n=1 Tax=Holospora curviuscula TaxID=1082868 RepID=A0A2S5RA75_9PROT|nr:phosphate acyltransferase PlsX [Holospora curviuscula]PPE04200.1 Phosphate acyltransferase [Holospora curviuscula]
MIRLSVDLMGADAGVAELLKGLYLFHKRRLECTFLLFGTRAALSSELKRYPLPKHLFEVVYAQDYVNSDAEVFRTLKSGIDTTMARALHSVVSGQAQGVISAGNTGVYLALSRFILKTLEGVFRPAIISQIPTCRGESVMLDLGGNLDNSSKVLVQYALMGKIFCQKVLGVESPSIGLLNVGTELQKGTDALKEAYDMLKHQKGLNFYGYVEGNDISKGTVDVVVTDGFTGNVALKTGEGTMRMMSFMLNRVFRSSFSARCAGWIAKPFLQDLKAYFDPRVYNGALWLGVRGVAVKSHGGTDSIGFSHALETAYDMVRINIVQEIQNTLLQQISTSE